MMYTVNKSLAYILSITRYLRRDDHQATLLAILIELGFPVYTDGFQYLMAAILIKQEHPGMRMTILYDEIICRNEEYMELYQIEQSIRRTIQKAWNRRNHKIWLYFFSEDELNKCPSNKVFISQMACVAKLLGSCEEVSYERE